MNKSNFRFYLMEMLAIAGFVIFAAATTMLLEYPASPVMETFLVHYPPFRRLLLGIVMGLYVALITLWAGKKSGAHANPIITFAFYRLRKISRTNACLYVISQFAGAVVAVILLRLFKYFSDPAVGFSLAKPQSPHTLMAGFTAEFIISFIFVAAILFGLSAKKLEKYLAWIIGMLICLFIVFELPYSGMSMNPARSFSGALAANKWTDLWIYFVAPIFGALLASELFLLWQGKSQGLNAVQQPIADKDKFWGSLTIPEYPVKS